MNRKLHRRSVVKGGLFAWLGSFGLNAQAETEERGFFNRIPDPRQGKHQISDKEYQAVIVGSGFGGAVTAARLSRIYGDEVLVVERGKRYPKGSFPREADDFLNAFWRRQEEKVPRPIPFPGTKNGVFDLRSYKGMDTLVAAGFGGGSLIYSAAFVKPLDPLFDTSWPDTIKREKLEYYYDVFGTAMGAQPVPTEGPGRKIIRQQRYQDAADANGGKFVPNQVAINFGPNPDDPDPMGVESVNPYGLSQESCRYCAECFIGCNYQAKNSLDLNYLHVAEKKYGAEVKTEHQVELIVPLDQNGQEDPDQNGEHGFHLYLRNLESSADDSYLIIKTQQVILAAGTYGSTEILMRSRDRFKTLPKISDKLGQGYSGNGDFMNFVFGTEEDDGSNFGPTVTVGTGYSLGKSGKNDESTVIEDFSYPSFSRWLEWIVLALEPKNPLTTWILMPSYNRILQAIRAQGSESSPLTIVLSVGLDKSDGRMSLDRNGILSLKWVGRNSKKLYDRMIGISKSYQKFWRAKGSTPFPTYLIGRNFTVHPLGGCALASTPNEGVTSASPETMGQVFHYKNLYVADGSLIPSALGSNPALTIGALSEMVAEGITGVKPTSLL